MQKLTVHIPSAPQSYEVLMIQDFDALLRCLKLQMGSRKSLLVTDKNVQKHMPLALREWPYGLPLPAGETHKNWKSIETILHYAFENDFDRSCLFVALGGGVVGDMAGFAASLFMRGVSFIQIPTTLLAMVDASVGGKTGIDCSYGKNLIGAFNQPEVVYCCLDFLKTLPAVEIKNGLAEMIKHGILGSQNHFEQLQSIASLKPKLNEIQPLILDSIAIKKKVVEEDEQEQSKRMALNLGHTFGHAIEMLSDYKIAHGQAVTMGTVMAAEYAEQNHICSRETTQKIRSLFEAFGFDLVVPFERAQIFEAMKHDKKKRGGKIYLVLPTRIGEVVVREYHPFHS